ncbi:MAG: hypothetical protein Q4G23_08250 [Clostridia bacterium]|nr:hypothetical protein [Clostridia bacterium]
MGDLKNEAITRTATVHKKYHKDIFGILDLRFLNPARKYKTAAESTPKIVPAISPVFEGVFKIYTAKVAAAHSTAKPIGSISNLHIISFFTSIPLFN